MIRCSNEARINKAYSIFERITGIYIFIMIILFPLLVDNTGFFRILECKYRYFMGLSIIYVSSSTIMFLYYLFKGLNLFKYKKIDVVQILGLIFLGINILSFLFSPYKKNYDLFVGLGRLEGLFTTSLYILSFLYISYFGKFKKKYILYFSISSILVNVIATLQYFGFNPLNMYQQGIGTHNVSFMATIGNIDFISALYTILLTISFAAYVFLENKKCEQIIHLLSIFLGSFIFQIINVSSGQLAFFLTLIIIFPFVFKDNIKLSRFINLIAIIMLATFIRLFTNIEYHYDLGRLGFYFRFDYIALILIMIVFILVYLSFYVGKINYNISNIKRFVINYYKIIILLIFISIICLYFIPFKQGFLYEIHELLHFNFDDRFGTFRIFLWKRTLPLITDYPILGTGPDTFVSRFMPLYSNDIGSIGEFSINDTAANIYLTMIINIGIIGLISYLSILLFQIYKGIKMKTSYSFVLLSTLICYMIQSFFNLSVVVVSPIFWVFMGVFTCYILKKDN